MAQKERKDLTVSTELDSIEQQIQKLKILYEKYFAGIDRVEPLRDRDDIRRRLRDLTDQGLTNSTQRFRLTQLRARIQSLELYWTRNLVMIERGTHPKQRFRADLKAPRGAPGLTPTLEPEVVPLSPEEEVLRRRQEQFEKEENALKLVYEKYMEARGKCGQTTDLAFDTVRSTLRQHVRQIKAQYGVESVKFRVYVEEGKAKVRAMPATPTTPTTPTAAKPDAPPKPGTAPPKPEQP